jgi:CYTH domain-containing protein
MRTEIEPKFLVVGDACRRGPGVAFVQGYQNRDKERTVRVRIAGESRNWRDSPAALPDVV